VFSGARAFGVDTALEAGVSATGAALGVVRRRLAARLQKRRGDAALLVGAAGEARAAYERAARGARGTGDALLGALVAEASAGAALGQWCVSACRPWGEAPFLPEVAEALSEAVGAAAAAAAAPELGDAWPGGAALLLLHAQLRRAEYLLRHPTLSPRLRRAAWERGLLPCGAEAAWTGGWALAGDGAAWREWEGAAAAAAAAAARGGGEGALRGPLSPQRGGMLSAVTSALGGGWRGAAGTRWSLRGGGGGGGGSGGGGGGGREGGDGEDSSGSAECTGAGAFGAEGCPLAEARGLLLSVSKGVGAVRGAPAQAHALLAAARVADA
jgi:hypothetical protein